MCSSASPPEPLLALLLVIGESPGSSPFVGAAHGFETQIGPMVQDSYPVLLDEIPEFVLPSTSGGLLGMAATRGAAGSPVDAGTPRWLLDGELTLQILMWNPGVFPGQPEQSTAGLHVRVLPGGQVVTTPFGTAVGGLEVWAEVSTNAEDQKVLRFLFSIDGM